MNEPNYGPYEIVLRDGRKFMYDSMREYTESGVSFMDDGVRRTFSCGAILYIKSKREPLFKIGGITVHLARPCFNTTAELVDGERLEVGRAEKAVGSKGYWYIRSFVDGVEYMVPLSSMIQITEDPIIEDDL